MKRSRSARRAGGVFLLVLSIWLTGPDVLRADDDDADVAEGHSHFGHVFNEGPRQKAYLMGGTGKIHFPVTTKDPEAQKFIEQGVGQLHGFWFYEAERSFRTAAALDPDCAMAYWGMAMANILNNKRFEGFAKEAEKRSQGITEREAMYIKALRDAEQLVKIIRAHPDDLEAKAFRAMLVGEYHAGSTHMRHRDVEVDRLCKEILAVEPMHPCHHYVIHAWDSMKEPYRALGSAEKCGPSAPSIAHMWHMTGGHVYARLWKYADAVFFQEASARVDHAQMIRDLLLPDQIHLYAHNNEWLVRNLGAVGRVHDAVSLAKNMIELPRHPKYNMLRERDEPSVDETTQSSEIQHDSSYYGRRRLFETLTQFELWDEMFRLADSPYLEPTHIVTEQTEYFRFVGPAYYRAGNLEKGDETLAAMRAKLDEQRKLRESELDAVENEARRRGAAAHELREDIEVRYGFRITQMERTIDEMLMYRELLHGTFLSTRGMKIAWGVSAVIVVVGIWLARRRKVLASLAFLVAVGLSGAAWWMHRPIDAARLIGVNFDPMVFANAQFRSGDVDEAIATAKVQVGRQTKHVWPLAHLVDLQWRAGRRDAAKHTFEELRELSAFIDLDVPVFARLTPIARELGYSEDWRVPPPAPPADNMRPPLDTLGPFRWQPPPAPEWKLRGADGQDHALADYRGKPVVVIFYLGAGCLHCAEQLAAFGPQTEAFKKAGIELIAVSSDAEEGLQASVKNYGGEGFPFPLVSNASLDVFKKYRCYDDFENQTLHGTFLINGDGKILWHDISFEPFMDADFVLDEAQRLLGQEAAAAAVAQH